MYSLLTEIPPYVFCSIKRFKRVELFQVELPKENLIYYISTFTKPRFSLGLHGNFSQNPVMTFTVGTVVFPNTFISLH